MVSYDQIEVDLTSFVLTVDFFFFLGLYKFKVVEWKTIMELDGGDNADKEERRKKNETRRRKYGIER